MIMDWIGWYQLQAPINHKVPHFSFSFFLGGGGGGVLISILIKYVITGNKKTNHPKS
jgi:hypothetical protein